MKTEIIQILNLDVPNKNGRIYPTDVMERVIKNFESKKVFGQLGLPTADAPVDVSKVTHYVDNLRIENGNLIGTAHIVSDNPLFYLDKEVTGFGFRPKGLGKIDENGVVTEYELLSIDLVRDPA